MRRGGAGFIEIEKTCTPMIRKQNRLHLKMMMMLIAPFQKQIYIYILGGSGSDKSDTRMTLWEYKSSVKFPFFETLSSNHEINNHENFIVFHVVCLRSSGVVYLSAEDVIIKLHGSGEGEPKLYLASLKQTEGALHCILDDGVQFTALNQESLEKAVLAYDGGNAQNNWARVIDIVRAVCTFPQWDSHQVESALLFHTLDNKSLNFR